MPTTLDPKKLETFVTNFWTDTVKSSLEDFIKIPCLNLNYVSAPDPSTAPKDHPKEKVECYYPKGYDSWDAAMKAAADLAEKYHKDLSDKYKLNSQIIRKDDVGTETTGKKTPMMLVHIPGDAKGNVFMWGHLDKQNTAGEDGKWTDPAQGPFCPVEKDGQLYGRGSSDDGFATFLMPATFLALKDQGLPMPTINLLIDFDEESGSQNVPPFLADPEVAKLVGTPSLVVTLDSGPGDYERLWYSVSERGTITGKLSVNVLKTSIHSGEGGGVIPNPMRIARVLIDRVQDPATGEVTPDFLKTNLPDEGQMKYVEQQANLVGDSIYGDFPWIGEASPITKDPLELVLSNRWKAAFAVTGIDGFPDTGNASNVIIPGLTYTISVRVPPNVNVDEAQASLKKLFESDPPYGAEVTYDYEGMPIGAGWFSSMPDWLGKLVNEASTAVFGSDKIAQPSGDGGTVPILAMLKEKFDPKNEGKIPFVATGAAGPGNNAHSPNEHLDIKYAQQLARCMAMVLAGTNEQS